MTEKTIHKWWMRKCLPISGIRLTNGQHLKIIHYGYYNETQAGPDFSLGIIELDDVQFFGPIEIHLKSSDWYKHGHQKDENYNNVILHVVYNHDQEIVLNNGYTLPTLELKGKIDLYDIVKQKFILERSRICSGVLSTVHPDLIQEMKLEAIITKWRQKGMYISSSNNSKTILNLLVPVFGRGVNNERYFNLGVTYLESEKSIVEILNTTCIDNWEKKGLFPSSFPTIRVPQFLYLLSCIDILIESNYSSFSASLNSINNELENRGVKRFSNDFGQNIFINVIIVYAFWNNLKKAKELMIDLQKLPPESNKITKDWKKDELDIKNAYDSQSLIGLNKYYCSRKKCLSCSIGKVVLRE